jgi:hypothetical protein
MPGDDQPRFAELDPALEGDEAITTTSMVQRRLAHRAGLRNDAPRSFPATEQHDVVVPPTEIPEGADAGEIIARQRQLGLWPWLAAGLVAVAILGYAAGLWP